MSNDDELFRNALIVAGAAYIAVHGDLPEQRFIAAILKRNLTRDQIARSLDYVGAELERNEAE